MKKCNGPKYFFCFEWTQFPKKKLAILLMKNIQAGHQKKNHDRNMVELNNIWHVVNTIANEEKNTG